MSAYQDRMIELMEIMVARHDETVSQLANLRKELKEEISELGIELKSEISE